MRASRTTLLQDKRTRDLSVLQFVTHCVLSPRQQIIGLILKKLLHL